MLAETNDIPAHRVDEVLELVGLTSVARQRAGKFSLGMGQRLGIAAALLGDPEVLLFDEPVNGLDPDGIRWVRNLLKGLAREGRTVFVSSHLMSEMALTADEVVIIGKGRLIAQLSDRRAASRRARSDSSASARPSSAQLRGALDGPGADDRRSKTTARSRCAAWTRPRSASSPPRLGVVAPRALAAVRLARGGLHGAHRGQRRVPRRGGSDARGHRASQR